MNGHATIDLHSTRGLEPFLVAICIHHDNNIALITSCDRSSYLWPANRASLMIWSNTQEQLFGLPMAQMRFEKHKPSFFPQSLVSIWSLPESPLAAPKQVSAASKLSSGPTVPDPLLLQKGEEGGAARICHSSRNHNSSHPSSKRRVKANSLWWPRSVKPMKRSWAKASRLPRSIGCSLAMGGALHQPIVQRTQIECNRHERFGQILHFSLSLHSSSSRLVNFVSSLSRFYSRRSYLCALGGYC